MNETTPTLANLHEITNRSSHDAAINKGQGTRPECLDGTPTLIFVSSSANPSCRTALPKVIDLARSHPKVQVYIMEMTPEITPMIKFGPQNTPIFIMLEGKFCETVLGPDFRRVKAVFEERWKGK